MQRMIGSCRLELVKGDITRQAVDAIVNAANSGLIGGSGVDGAIHRAGGPAIMQETDERYPDGCPTGSAVASTAGDLPARYVFHAVGPIWQGGFEGEPEQLAGAYRRCLDLALQHDCQSVAFPAISTGVYRYPLDEAANVSLTTVIEFLRAEQRPELVRFVLFNDAIYDVFAQTCEQLVPSPRWGEG